jgi:hypothetical protein
MIVVYELAAGRKEAIRADFDALPRIELATETDENAVANHDRWTGRPRPVKLQVYPMLEVAVRP